MTLTSQLLLGSLLCAATVVIHGAALMGPSKGIIGPNPEVRRRLRIPMRWLVVLLVIYLMLLHLAESALWAAAYRSLGLLEDYETALYFSLASYTTTGYGDVVLPRSSRLLGTFQAIIGWLMFGWSTALLVAAISKTYDGHPPAESQSFPRFDETRT